MDREAEHARQREIQSALREKLEARRPAASPAEELLNLAERTSWGVELALSLLVTTALRIDDLVDRVAAIEARLERD